MLDDAAELLGGAGQEAGHVLEGDERDVEAVAEAHEARALERGVDVEAAGQVRGLVGHDPDRPAAEPPEADDEVRREVGLDLEEVPVVEHRPHDVLDVVGLVRLLRAPPSAAPRPRRSTGSRVARTGGSSELFWGRKVSSSRMRARHSSSFSAAKWATPEVRAVGGGAAQLLERDLLVGHRPDHVGPGHEHVGGVLDHEHEVGDGRRVDRAARARPHDGRDLRHHARGQGVAQEDVGVAGQRDHALLDPRAARVVEADDRGARLHGEVHDLADLPRVGLGERAAEDREVLGEHEDRPAVDAPRAGHHPVARDALLVHAEVAALVDDEAVHLGERALVEQQLDAARAPSSCPPCAAGRCAPAPPAELGRLVAAAELVEAIVEGHGRDLCWWSIGAAVRGKSMNAGASRPVSIDLRDAPCHTRIPMTPLAVGVILACVVALTIVLDLHAALVQARRPSARRACSPMVEREIRPMASELESLTGGAAEAHAQGQRQPRADRRGGATASRTSRCTAARVVGAVGGLTRIGQYAGMAAGVEAGRRGLPSPAQGATPLIGDTAKEKTMADERGSDAAGYLGLVLPRRHRGRGGGACC